MTNLNFKTNLPAMQNLKRIHSWSVSAITVCFSNLGRMW